MSFVSQQQQQQQTKGQEAPGDFTNAGMPSIDPYARLFQEISEPGRIGVLTIPSVIEAENLVNLSKDTACEVPMTGVKVRQLEARPDSNAIVISGDRFIAKEDISGSATPDGDIILQQKCAGVITDARIGFSDGFVRFNDLPVIIAAGTKLRPTVPVNNFQVAA